MPRVIEWDNGPEDENKDDEDRESASDVTPEETG